MVAMYTLSFVLVPIATGFLTGIFVVSVWLIGIPSTVLITDTESRLATYTLSMVTAISSGHFLTGILVEPQVKIHKSKVL